MVRAVQGEAAMKTSDSTDVVQGDEQCRDGHYRAKLDLRTNAPTGNGAVPPPVLDPNDSASVQAQIPTDLGKLRVGVASQEAAGIPAIWNTMLYGIGDIGPLRAPEVFLKINQVTGFDCQSCAWPSPDKKRKLFEFCENGAKAVSDESTKKRIGPEFFAKYSIAELAAKSDYWLNQQGRLTSPMVRHAGATHYQPITWPETFAMIAEELNRLDSPNQACFYTSGKTTNEPAFLLQLFARQFGTNNLPDCSNMCHESSGVAMVETLGVGKGTATLEDMESTDLIFIFGNNPGTNHPRMLTSLQKAKDHGAKIIAVNPLPEVSMMRVTNPNPQDYPNPLELPIALVGKGQALADLYLPVRVNGDTAAIKGILKDLFERERAGHASAIDRELVQTFTEGLEALLADLEATSWEEIEENSGLTRNQLRVAADMYAASKKTICAWCTGLTQQRNGVDNVSMIVNLLLVGGNIGRPGAGTVCVRVTRMSRVTAPWVCGSARHSVFWMYLGKSSTLNHPGNQGMTPSRVCTQCSRATSRCFLRSAAISFRTCLTRSTARTLCSVASLRLTSRPS
jgi:molybdopterin-dependent oxidoreductase alpha subunit